MLKKISYFIVILAVIFVVVGQFLPREVHVERSRLIDRPASTVYTVLNSYRHFAAWSPWAGRDPDAVYERSGPPSGPGARLGWSGDPRLGGTGWREIVASEPYERISVSLHFEQQGDATAYFQLDPTPGGTRVTWGFDTDLVEGQGWLGGLLARYFGLFFDTWIGSDYEEGLAGLEDFVEDLPPIDFSDLEVRVVDAEPVDILYVDIAQGFESSDLASSLAQAYRELAAFMERRGIERSAQPMAITRLREGGGYEMQAAIPVRLPPSGLPPAPVSESGPDPEAAGSDAAGELAETAASPAAAGRVRLGQSPAGRCVMAVHYGPHDRMAPTYEKLAAWMAAHGIGEGSVSWEQYISDPGETADSALVTHIYTRASGND